MCAENCENNMQIPAFDVIEKPKNGSAKKYRFTDAEENDRERRCPMFLLENEMFERKEDMLLYALEEGILKEIDVLEELQGMIPEDMVQLVMDYGNMDEICASLLEFDEEERWE